MLWRRARCWLLNGMDLLSIFSLQLMSLGCGTCCSFATVLYKVLSQALKTGGKNGLYFKHKLYTIQLGHCVTLHILKTETCCLSCTLQQITQQKLKVLWILGFSGPLKLFSVLHLLLLLLLLLLWLFIYKLCWKCASVLIWKDNPCGREALMSTQPMFFWEDSK